MSTIRAADRRQHEAAWRRLRRGQAAAGAMEAIIWATGAGFVLAVSHGLVEAVRILGWEWGTIAWVTLGAAALIGAGLGYHDTPR